MAINYSTGMELVLTGLGSTSTPLKGRIENRIPGYIQLNLGDEKSFISSSYI